MKFLVFGIILISLNVSSREYVLDDQSTIFSGRISKINRDASLLRIKINFENAKYLTRNNIIEFWNESYPSRRCKTYLKGRTSEYLLLRVPNFKECNKKVPFATGSYLHMESPDLQVNLGLGRELMKVLMRKRTALEGRKKRHEKNINLYIEKTDALNRRYEILRQKLEIEWKKELADLEEDKLQSQEELQRTNSRLNEVDFKLQQYRVRDQNLIEDRWSLDPNLYTKR